VPIITRP